MMLEERMEVLEQENKDLKERLGYLESKGTDNFVTVKELARIMSCSTTNIHAKIKKGEIYATRKAGDPRVPLSQFYDSSCALVADTQEEKQSYLDKPGPVRRKKTEPSIREMVFGA